MKKIILISAVVSISFVGFGQQTQNGVSTMRIYKMENSTTPEEKKQLSAEEEIQQCKDLLHALDTKEAWIRSNPEELKIAEETGWFEDAAETRAKLQDRIKELESTNN